MSVTTRWGILRKGAVPPGTIGEVHLLAWRVAWQITGAIALPASEFPKENTAP
jgi:hypothetical protein